MMRYFDFTKIDKTKKIDGSVLSNKDYPEYLQITQNTKIVFHKVNEQKIVEEIVNKELTTNQKNYLVLCRYFDCLQIIYQLSQDYSSLNKQELEFIFDMIKVESIKNKSSEVELQIYYYPYKNVVIELDKGPVGIIVNLFVKIFSYFYFQLNVSFINFESLQQDFFAKLCSHMTFENAPKIHIFHMIPFFENLASYDQAGDVDTKIEKFKHYINKLTSDYKIFNAKICKKDIVIADLIENIQVEPPKPNCEIHCTFVKAIQDFEGRQFNLPANDDLLMISHNKFVFSLFSNDPNALERNCPKFDRITELLEKNYEYKDISSFVLNVYYHLFYKDPEIKDINNANYIFKIIKNLNNLTKNLTAKKDDKSITLNKENILKLYELHELIKDQIFRSIERENAKKTKKSKKKKKLINKGESKQPDETGPEQPDKIEPKQPDEIDTKQYDTNIITINKEEILLIDQNLQKFYDTIIEFKKLRNKKDFFVFMENKKIDYKSELSNFFAIYDNIDRLINNYNEFNMVYEDIQLRNDQENTGISLIANQTNFIDVFCISAIQNRSNFYLLFGKILKLLIKCNLNKQKYFDRKTIDRYLNINTIEKCFKISAYSTNNSESFLKLAHIYRQDLKAWKYSFYKNDFKIDPKKYRDYLDASAYFNNAKANLELCKLFMKEKKYSNASYLLYRLDYKSPESYLIKSSVLEKIDFRQSVQIILNFAFVNLEDCNPNIPYQEIVYSVLFARNRLFELLFKYFNHTVKRESNFHTEFDVKYKLLFNEIAKKTKTSPEFGQEFTVPRIIFLLNTFKTLLKEITIFNSKSKINSDKITDLKILSKINDLRCEAEKNLCEIDLILLYNDNQKENKNNDNASNERFKYTNDRKIYDRLKDLFYIHNYYPASLLLCQLYFEIGRYNEMENSISNKSKNSDDNIIEINDDIINDIIEEKDRLLISQGKSNEFYLFAINNDVYQSESDSVTYLSLFNKTLSDKDTNFAKIFNTNGNDEKSKTEKDK